MKKYNYNSIDFIVGQSAEENWKIILQADRSYYWLHADNIPSAHIIICTDKPLKDDYIYACNLCKEQTKINKTIEYISTPIRNIKLGSKPGEVYFRDQNKITKHSY
jgi:predicted ribosome quality control (RQC) complex YloA/Tae2 family protein